MEQQLRAYHFQNMYLTGIHAGIQTQHCTVEMFLKYTRSSQAAIHTDSDATCEDTLFSWASKHKTTIILNGGYASCLRELCALFESKDNPYPWAYFKESDEALNGCVTNVGIILPEKVFNYTKDLDEGARKYGYEGVLSEWEINLAGRISKCRLMN